MGLPLENLTDQDTNFMSSLLNEVCKLLKIPRSHRVLYQPETDGLVEYFNQTLKQMLRKFISSEPKHWDKLLPFV